MSVRGASSSADFAACVGHMQKESATLPTLPARGASVTQGSKMVGRPAGWCLIAVAAVVAAAGQATADCITNCYDPDEACPACYKDCTCKSVPNCTNNCNSPGECPSCINQCGCAELPNCITNCNSPGECPSCYKECGCSSSPPPVTPPPAPVDPAPLATGRSLCKARCQDEAQVAGPLQNSSVYILLTVDGNSATLPDCDETGLGAQTCLPAGGPASSYSDPSDSLIVARMKPENGASPEWACTNVVFEDCAPLPPKTPMCGVQCSFGTGFLNPSTGQGVSWPPITLPSSGQITLWLQDPLGAPDGTVTDDQCEKLCDPFTSDGGSLCGGTGVADGQQKPWQCLGRVVTPPDCAACGYDCECGKVACPNCTDFCTCGRDQTEAEGWFIGCGQCGADCICGGSCSACTSNCTCGGPCPLCTGDKCSCS